MDASTMWWLTKTETGRRFLARTIPPRVFEQMTGYKHPETLERQEDERRAARRREKTEGKSR